MKIPIFEFVWSTSPVAYQMLIIKNLSTKYKYILPIPKNLAISSIIICPTVEFLPASYQASYIIGHTVVIAYTNLIT